MNEPLRFYPPIKSPWAKAFCVAFGTFCLATSIVWLLFAILTSLSSLVAHFKGSTQSAPPASHSIEQQRPGQSDRELQDWANKVSRQIKSRMVTPHDVDTAGKVAYKVKLTPAGDVAGIHRVSSSGLPAYDRAVMQAIVAAAPLPIPSDPRLFEQVRQMTLHFQAK